MVNKVIIGSDHAGYELKSKVIKELRSKGLEVVDCGTDSTESTDYPDFAHLVGESVQRAEGMGVVICGSGNGVNMTVNKYSNVRGALCWTPEIAELARQHNDANVLAIPARYVDDEIAFSMVDAFLSTEFEGGRHERRVNKINC